MNFFDANPEDRRIETGLRIKKLLKKKNKSQKDLSEAILLGQPTVNKIINGKAELTYYNACSMANYFGVDVRYLLLEMDCETSDKEVARALREGNSFEVLTEIRLKGSIPCKTESKSGESPYKLTGAYKIGYGEQEFLCPEFMYTMFVDDIMACISSKREMFLKRVKKLNKTPELINHYSNCLEVTIESLEKEQSTEVCPLEPDPNLEVTLKRIEDDESLT